MNIEDIATKEDIRQLNDSIIYLGNIMTEFVHEMQNQKVYSVSELAKTKTIGGRDRINTLIRTGKLQTTSDGKITQSSLNAYCEKR